MEAYDLTTGGGATDFARLIAACETFGPYCIIGGLAVNCYVEPVYTLDADIVMVSASLPLISVHLREQGYKVEDHPHSVNAWPPGSELRIQFTTDERYQGFPGKAAEAATVLAEEGTEVEVLDLRFFRNPAAALCQRIKDLSPDIIGFTGYSHEASMVKALATAARQAAPAASVIAIRL